MPSYVGNNTITSSFTDQEIATVEFIKKFLLAPRYDNISITKNLESVVKTHC
jgi:hypothetical protein